MPPDGAGPPSLVHPGVEDPGPVWGQAGVGADSFQDVVQLSARGQVPHAAGIPFIAGRINQVDHPPAVIAQIDAARSEEVLPFGLLVGIEDHLLPRQGGRVPGPDDRRVPIIGGSDRHPAGGPVLLPLPGAAEVPVAVKTDGHGHVVLLHMVLQLLEEGGGQRFEAGQAMIGIGVLPGHVFLDLGRFLFPQPFVLVHELVPGHAPDLRGPGRDRRGGPLGLVRHPAHLFVAGHRASLMPSSLIICPFPPHICAGKGAWIS